MISRIRTMFFGFMAVMLTACSNDGVLVTANFANTQDIKEGTSVYFGDTVLGSVSDISRTEYGSVVQMDLDLGLSQKVNSRAAVVVNRLRQGAPLELHNPPGPVKQSLQAGQSVEALDSMLQLFGWGISGTVEAGTQSITEFKEYINSDEFERDKAEVAIVIDESLKVAKDSLSEAEKVVMDVAGNINLSEKELAVVVERLGDNLAPMVKELAQGGAELMLELERLSKNLEQKSAGDRQTGEAFLDSLTEALETLNKNIDAGLDNGLNVETPPAG